MKFSDFDKQIQQNAAQDLIAPSDLDWDNMDITLPKKKSKKPLIILLLMSTILISGSMYYLYIQTTNNGNIQGKEQLSKTKAIASQANENTTNTKVKSDKTLVVDNHSIIQNNVNKSVKSSTDRQKVITTNTNSISNDFYKKIEKTTIQSEQKTTQKTIEKDEVEDFNISIEKNEIQLPKPLTTLNYQLLNTQKGDLQKLSILSEDSEEKNETTVPSGNNSLTLLSRTNNTSNHFNTSNSEYLKVMNASDVSAWSQSLTIRKAFPLTKNLFGSVGLSYHNLHTAFSHSKYLGFEDVTNDAGETERISRTRVVYHNNYSNIGALNIGLGKIFSIANQLDFQFQLGFNGGYQFSDNGKTLDSSLEIVKKALNNNNRFVLSTTADAHVVYNLNSFKLLVGGGFSKFLTNTNSVDNTILTNRPTMFFLDLGVGYQF